MSQHDDKTPSWVLHMEQVSDTTTNINYQTGYQCSALRAHDIAKTWREQQAEINRLRYTLHVIRKLVDERLPATYITTGTSSLDGVCVGTEAALSPHPPKIGDPSLFFDSNQTQATTPAEEDPILPPDPYKDLRDALEKFQQEIAQLRDSYQTGYGDGLRDSEELNDT